VTPKISNFKHAGHRQTEPGIGVVYCYGAFTEERTVSSWKLFQKKLVQATIFSCRKNKHIAPGKVLQFE